ncbi:unnamed protein product [Amoebophrya sp. A25]|nr:unnamed protein product [Amoebophrya sp. A25]|eukprot:GSA25T00017494001.1
MFGGSIFDNDPFFSGFGSRRNEQPRGGNRDRQLAQRGSNADPFAAMEQSMSQMMGDFPMMRGGMGDPFSGGRDPFGDMHEMMSSRPSGGRGSGFSSSSSMFISSKMGADGQMHTERYSSSAVHDGSRDAFEQQQAYSNSSTGVDKMSLERQHGGRGRKMVKEYSHTSGEDRQTEYLRGLESDACKADFDRHWGQNIAPHMPRHSHLGRGMGGHQGALGVESMRGGGGRGSQAIGYDRSSRRRSDQMRALGN